LGAGLLPIVNLSRAARSFAGNMTASSIAKQTEAAWEVAGSKIPTAPAISSQPVAVTIQFRLRESRRDHPDQVRPPFPPVGGSGKQQHDNLRSLQRRILRRNFFHFLRKEHLHNEYYFSSR
jgi:hypothetical protein